MVLSVSHLKKQFLLENYSLRFGKKAALRAVDDISFELTEGSVTGLVGESGSGKSTVAKLILQLIKPNSGQIAYKGISLAGASKKDQRFLRREIQMIFQNPYLSFNPHLKIKSVLKEVLKAHFSLSRNEMQARMVEHLRQVNLPEDSLEKYPAQFSGGQQQRLAIVRALAVNPKFLVADEPVSSLDVSNQVQILKLLQSLESKKGLTILMISHDLRMVRQIAEHVLVMYAGKILEKAPADSFFAAPAHPYSGALLRSTPKMTGNSLEKKLFVQGEPPDLTRPLPACPFAPRCPKTRKICFTKEPEWKTLAARHQVWCHLPNNSL